MVHCLTCNVITLQPPPPNVHIRHFGHANNSGLTSTHTMVDVQRLINTCFFHKNSTLITNVCILYNPVLQNRNSDTKEQYTTSYDTCWGQVRPERLVWCSLLTVVSDAIFPILFSFLTYHLVCNYSNTTSANSGAGTAYPSGAPEFIPGFQWGWCYSIFSFMCIFCRPLFVLLYFFFWPLCCLFFKHFIF